MKIIGIIGTTASGKTDVGYHLKNYKNYKIINADSVQIYKDCPILKAMPENLDGHVLYDQFLHENKINVCQWGELVLKEIEESKKLNQNCAIVGGTAFYFKFLQEGFIELPEVSEEIDLFVEKLSFNHVFKFLKQNDAKSCEKFKDERRLKKAMKIFLQTNKSIFDFFEKEPEKVINEDISYYAILPPKDVLTERIYNRLTNNFEKMVKEVQEFIDQDYEILGFSEIKRYIKKEIDESECISKIIDKTQQYAKRQRTFINNSLKIDQIFESHEELKKFLNNF